MANSIGPSGFLGRWILALVLVLGTYNPTGFSYVGWVFGENSEFGPVMAIVGPFHAGAWASNQSLQTERRPDATVDFMSKVIAATPATTDQDHARLLVDQNPAVPSRQAALLDGGEDELCIFCELPDQRIGVVGDIYAVFFEAVKLLHGLVVEVFPVDHKKHLIDIIQLGSQTRCLKTG